MNARKATILTNGVARGRAVAHVGRPVNGQIFIAWQWHGNVHMAILLLLHDDSAILIYRFFSAGYPYVLTVP